MNGTKTPLASTGIWGGIAALCVGIFMLFDLPAEDQAHGAALIESVVVSVGGLMAIVGRWRASKAIRVALLAPMLCFMLLGGCGSNQSTPALGVGSGEQFDSWQTQTVVQHTPIYFGRLASSVSGFETAVDESGETSILPMAGEAESVADGVGPSLPAVVRDALQGGSGLIYVNSITINPTNTFGTDAGRSGSGAANVGGTMGATTQEASPTTEIEASGNSLDAGP